MVEGEGEGWSLARITGHDPGSQKKAKKSWKKTRNILSAVKKYRFFFVEVLT